MGKKQKVPRCSCGGALQLKEWRFHLTSRIAPGWHRKYWFECLSCHWKSMPEPKPEWLEWPRMR